MWWVFLGCHPFSLRVGSALDEGLAKEMIQNLDVLTTFIQNRLLKCIVNETITKYDCPSMVAH